MEITNPKNPRLQDIHRAASAGRLTEAGCIVAEGPHLLGEALGSACSIDAVFTTAESRARFSTLFNQVRADVVELSERAYAAAATTENGQGILTLLRPRSWSWADLICGTPLIVVLDGVQDPGNAGTIVRSAEAFGASGIVLLKGSVRIANGKFLRATAGSILRLPFLEAVSSEWLIGECRRAGVAILNLTADGRTSIADADLRHSCALVTGNEGAGISSELTAAGQHLRIPTQHVESLNAAIACSVALFEAQRQRNTR